MTDKEDKTVQRFVTGKGRAIGYTILKELYKRLEPDKFWNNILKNTSIQYNPEAVFRLLVFSRILYPGSQMDTFNSKDVYFEEMKGFSLKDVYRSPIQRNMIK